MTQIEITDFWRTNREEILREDDAQRQEMRKPFRRPGIYLDEIERDHPRRQVGTETWAGPRRPDGTSKMESEPVYEDDPEYLNRLGLLADWELSIYQQQGGDHADK